MKPCGEIRIYNHKTNDHNITRENGEYIQTPFLKPRKKNGCETDKGREESGGQLKLMKLKNLVAFIIVANLV